MRSKTKKQMDVLHRVFNGHRMVHRVIGRGVPATQSLPAEVEAAPRPTPKAMKPQEPEDKAAMRKRIFADLAKKL